MTLSVYNVRRAGEANVNDSRGNDIEEGAAATSVAAATTAKGKTDVLKMILEELDGVNDVIVYQSKIDATTTTSPTASSNAEHPAEQLVDPTSCTVKIDYVLSNSYSAAADSNADAATKSVTDNPQEPRDDDASSILTRLTEAGFDYAVISKSDTASAAKTNATNTSNNNHANGSTMNKANKASSSAPAKKLLSCRTRLRVEGICCSSEVPIVRNILRPLPGVRKLGINVATKVVFVDHDPTVIEASLLASALEEQKFAAEILTDGGAELRRNAAAAAASSSDEKKENEDGATVFTENAFLDLPRSNYVESTFFIPGTVRYTKDQIRDNDGPIGKLLKQNFFATQLRAFHIHPPSRTLKVEHDPKLLGAEKIRDVLVRGLGTDDSNDWGTIELAHDGAVEGLTLPVMNNDADQQNNPDESMQEEKGCHGLKLNVVLSGIFWILSLFSHFYESAWFLKYFGIGAVLCGLPPVVVKAWSTVRRWQFDANCMMVTAAFGALLLGEYDEAASVSFFFAVSEWCEARATGKARRAMGEIMSLRPEYANVVDGKGGIVIVPATNIPVGSIVSVRTGDKCPSDGVVVEGSSTVDESSLTGEARPVEKRAGDEVSGGSINVGSQQLVVKTTSTVEDSTLSRLIQLVEEAQANTSETEKLVDAFARKYTPVVLTIAFFICTVPWAFGPDVGRYWMLNGLIFMVIACPCALTISTPVTYSAGLAATAQRGIIIKGGNRLEALGNVKTVLLDKTGTITTGKFALSHLELIGERRSRKEVLELLSLMEAPSSHPLSACLVSAAKEEGVTMPDKVSLRDHTILKGEGVSANVDGKKVYVGNERLFNRIGMYNISTEEVEAAKEWSEEGGTVGYIGIEGVGIIGMFCVKDTIRDEAEAVISFLQQSGIEVIMLTGDGDGAAQAVGKEIGLTESCIKSQLLPEDKLHYVSSLKGSSTNNHASISGKKKLILMVGDGVNDAPALSVADVGVAMGEGASLAMEMSDVTLMDSNLSKLLFSMNMGQKVIKTVKENIATACLVNLVAVVLTFMGKMTLLWAIISDVGVMLLVTLNGMKLLSSRTIARIEQKTPKEKKSMLPRSKTKRKGGQRYSRTLSEDRNDDDGVEMGNMENETSTSRTKRKDGQKYNMTLSEDGDDEMDNLEIV